MAELNQQRVDQLSDYNSYSSDSSSDDYSNTDDEAPPIQPQLQPNVNANAPPRPPQRHQQQQQNNENLVLVKTMLMTLGFQTKYIEKAIRQYEKTYGTEHYSQDEIIQIILSLQDKAEFKQKKANIAAMNLDPKLAEEIFGKKYKSKSSKKDKKKSKSSGFRPGQVVVYRNKLEVQILDNLDDYVQVCWPLKKSFYKRAVLWVNVSQITKKEKKKEKKSKSQNVNQKIADNENKKLFGLFSSKQSSKTDVSYSKYHKNEYKFEKLWKDMIVHDFEPSKPVQHKVSDNDQKKILLRMDIDDDDEKMAQKKVKMSGKKAIFAQLKYDKNSHYEFMQETKEKFNILSKFDVQNETIFDLFSKRKELILQHSLDGNESKLNIQTLWYSGSRNQIYKILNFGFKRKFGSAYSFGFGHKMYKNANDAINGFGDYPNIKSDDDVQYLMQCEVICGESCLGVQNSKLPPAKASKSYILFETSVHSMFENNNKYFIIHQDHQAMPLNVICFKERAKLKLKKKPMKFASPRKSKPKRRDGVNPPDFLQHYHANSPRQQQQGPPQPPPGPLPPQHFGYNVNPANIPPLPPQQQHAHAQEQQLYQRFIQRAQRRAQQQQQQQQQQQ